MNKARKPLDQTLAREFVYGGDGVAQPEDSTKDLGAENARENASKSRRRIGNEQSTTGIEEVNDSMNGAIANLKPSEVKQTAKQSMKKSLKTSSETVVGQILKQENAYKEPTVRITVDLPKSMHRKLSLLSARTDVKKAAIVRMLLADALQEIED